MFSSERVLSASTPSFNAIIQDDCLVLPQRLLQPFCENAHITTAKAFISFLRTDTYTIAMLVDWNIASLEEAIEEMTSLLTGRIDAAILSIPRPPPSEPDREIYG